jgi:hypothetical protein
VKECIDKYDTIKEMAKACGCGTDKLRKFMITNDLHPYYVETHPFARSCEKLVCSVCGEINDVSKLKGIPYCKRHYLQMYRYGKIYDKTIYDKNDYVFDKTNNIVKIVLRDKYQNINGYAVIDYEDYDKVKDYKWYLSRGYCVTKGINKNNEVDIYCVIFNNFTPYDHIDNDRLNDRKHNLRLATSQQNSMNMSIKNTNKSGVTGVQRRNPKSPRWTAGITYKYESIWLGVYESFDDAVLARLKGEAHYFKEYSNNYNPNKNNITLEYISKNDNLLHHIEISLEEEIQQNYIVDLNRKVS